MIKLKLGDNMSDCPIEWRLFVNHIINEYGGQDTWNSLSYRDSSEILNENLAHYKAYVSNEDLDEPNLDSLFFDDDAGYVLFKLRFGL
jgi:hypothetical protein